MSPDVRRVAAIDYRLTPYDWHFVREAAERIDAYWEAIKRDKPALYDGRVLVAHRFGIDLDEGGTLHAQGFETGYKPFLAWRDFGFTGAPVFNLFAMGALQSADGAFMLGRMSAGTASAGRLYFPAGTPEPSDARDGVVDLEGSILRELAEETGFTAGDVALARDWTLVFDEARIACMRLARSRWTAAEMMARFAAFQATETEPELEALVPVRSPDDFDPACMPAFMLTYMKHAFA